MVLWKATPWEDIGKWRKAFRVGARVIVWILVVAAAANIFGFAALADYLVRFVYISVYDALVLTTAALVLQGLWVAILRTPFALKSQAVERHTRLLDRRGITIIQISALIVWAGFVMDRVALLGPTLGALGSVLSAQATFGEISVSLGDLLLFILTMYLAVLTSRFIRFVFEQDVAPRLSLPRGVPRAISISTQYIVVSFGFILALSVAGLDLSSLTILAGAFGLGIGIGMQGIINNFVSGLILLFERPIQIDDTIEMGPLIGRVRRIGMRSSTVRTYDGAEVIVPNASLISAEVTNWTLSDQRRRLSVSVGVAYGTDPNRVLEILRDVAMAHESVLPEPEPWALFLGFGDSSLDFDVRFWVVTYEEGLQVLSEVAVAIDTALKEADITIPFPQRDLHLRSVDGGVTQAMARDGGMRGE
jgi:small-conductance mechanosensitive channel